MDCPLPDGLLITDDCFLKQVASERGQLFEFADRHAAGINGSISPV
jgi:hypothetical protein